MARPQAPRGQGRARVIDAALDLFAQHGVSGSSLQMIADHLGVTKAAVYYQFQAKEDIVLAVVESAFDDMRAFLAAAEAAPTPEAACDLALVGLVDLMTDHRRAVATLVSDPEVGRIVEGHAEFRDLVTRLNALLLGPDPSLRRRVAVAVVGSGLAQAGVDPYLADVDSDLLHDELLHLGRSMLATTSLG